MPDRQSDYGYQGQPGAGMMSPKTEADAHDKTRNFDGSVKQPPMTEHKTEPGFPGGDSTNDGHSQGFARDHDASRLSNAFGAQH